MRHNTPFLAVFVILLADIPAILEAGSGDGSAPVLRDTLLHAEPRARSETLAEAWWGPENRFDSRYGEYLTWKEEKNFPITLGAWHWFTIDDILGTGYGSPGLRGTYYWIAKLDLSREVAWGPVEEVGYHVQNRFRDTSDKFRAFFDSTYWTYENYVYGRGDFGTVKIGEVWRRFGLDWDNTFWGNPGYFDGFKLDTDYGISWESSFARRQDFAVDAYLQYFLTENNVNGSLVGGDAESVGGLHERHGALLRLVPTWTLPDDSTLALGLTTQFQAFDGDERFPIASSQWAWAADLTWTKGNFSIFSEVSGVRGAANPARWTSGGPSDELYAVLGGLAYQMGPVQWRINGSAGWDRNPSGRQLLFNPGATIQLTENSTLWLEYTIWDIENAAGVESRFSEGVQIAVNWTF